MAEKVEEIFRKREERIRVERDIIRAEVEILFAKDFLSRIPKGRLPDTRESLRVKIDSAKTLLDSLYRLADSR